MRSIVAVSLALASIVLPASADAAPSRCTEDMPCFNWATMGNHDRGVRLIDGRKLVVKPCRFQRLAKAGRLAYWPMKGDRTAMRRDGCRR